MRTATSYNTHKARSNINTTVTAATSISSTDPSIFHRRNSKPINTKQGTNMQPHTKKKAATGCLLLLLQYAVQAQLTNGLAAYWPLATSTGCNNQTPELVHGYTMDVL